MNAIKFNLVLTLMLSLMGLKAQQDSVVILSDVKTILHQIMIHDEVVNEIYYSSKDEVERDTTFHTNHFRIYSPEFVEDYYHEGVYVLAYDSQHVYFDTNYVLVQECFENLFHMHDVSGLDTHRVVEIFDSVLSAHIEESWFEFKAKVDNPYHSKKGYHLAELHLIKKKEESMRSKLEVEYINDDKTIYFELAHIKNEWVIQKYTVDTGIDSDDTKDF